MLVPHSSSINHHRATCVQRCSCGQLLAKDPFADTCLLAAVGAVYFRCFIVVEATLVTYSLRFKFLMMRSGIKGVVAADNAALYLDGK